MPHLHQRYVAYIKVDTPHVSVKRKLDYRLRKQPVIIGGQGGRGIVVDCCHEAMARGVRSGMPVKWAKMLCPEARILPENRDELEQHCDHLERCLIERTPLCERTGMAAFFVDLTGMDLFGQWKWLLALRRRIAKETMLPLSMGLASSKLMAEMAVDPCQPECRNWIRHGQEQAYMDTLPIARIPSVGPTMVRQLADMKVQDIPTLRQIPREILATHFGKMGENLWEWANAIDTTAVTPRKQQKMFHAHVNFEQDTIDVAGMTTSTIKLTEDLVSRLRADRRLTACIQVTVRYADREVKTRQCTMPFTSSTAVLRKKAVELLNAAFERRLRVRQIAIVFSKLVYGGHQINLLEDTQRQISLDEATDKMRTRYGKNALWSAAAIGGIGEVAVTKPAARRRMATIRLSPARKPKEYDPQAWYPDPVHEDFPSLEGA